MEFDRIIIEEKEGTPRFIAEGETVKVHPAHIHRFNKRGRCRICKRSKKQIEAILK